jgi:hypothetical protein
MTQNEHLFISTIFDLQEKLEKANLYSIVRASGLIRQLLIDEKPLLNQINRKYKEKIVFKVQINDDIYKERINNDGTISKPWFALTFINPDINSKNFKLLNKDNFLKYKPLFYQEKEFSVLDIIKICSNKYGGIHLDELKNEQDIYLDKLNSTFNLNNFDCVIVVMYDIANICLNSLLPLTKKINEQNVNNL